MQNEPDWPLRASPHFAFCNFKFAFCIAPSPPRSGRILWPALIFLAGFAILLAAVSYYFLLPGYEAAAEMDPEGRRRLRATARLLMVVILVILALGLLMVFRLRRYLLGDEPAGHTRTPHVDAWKEAGKRAKAPEKDEE